MSHGRPDWYNIAPLIQIHASEDVAELAARLGAPNTVDRRGNVVAYEDFSRGNAPWFLVTNDAGSLVNWCAAPGLYHSFALRMTGVAGATKYIRESRLLPFPAAGSVGVEWGWSHEIIPTAVEHWIRAEDGTNHHDYGVKYTFATGVMAYWDGAAYQTLYTDPTVFYATELFSNYLKLAVDIEAGEYLRLITNDRTDSMAGIAGGVSASADYRNVEPLFTVYSDASLTTLSWLEWMTLTVNER